MPQAHWVPAGTFQGRVEGDPSGSCRCQPQSHLRTDHRPLHAQHQPGRIMHFEFEFVAEAHTHDAVPDAGIEIELHAGGLAGLHGADPGNPYGNHMSTSQHAYVRTREFEKALHGALQILRSRVDRHSTRKQRSHRTRRDRCPHRSLLFCGSRPEAASPLTARALNRRTSPPRPQSHTHFRLVAGSARPAFHPTAVVVPTVRGASARHQSGGLSRAMINSVEAQPASTSSNAFASRRSMVRPYRCRTAITRAANQQRFCAGSHSAASRSTFS